MAETIAKVGVITQEKATSRSLVVVAAVLIQLCLGALYAWSVFTPQLTLPIADGGLFAFTKTQTQIVFSVSIAVFAIAMIFAGRWQAKSGPRIVSLVGGIVFGAGYILAGLFGKSFITQIMFIGVIGGAGIGLVYVCPVAVGMKWFPDKKGMITGLAVAGFGFGAVIWIKLAGSWGGLIESMGVLKVFLLYGIIFAAVVIFGSIWMVNPPEGWKPAGWNANADKKKGSAGDSRDLAPREMLRRSQFYGLWAMFIFFSMAGLIVIGNIKLFGIETLTKSFSGTMSAAAAAAKASAAAGTAMAIFYSIANGLGRIIWGTLSDRTGRKNALVIMCAFQGVMMLVFYWMGGNQYLLYLAAAIIGFNYGGGFSLFPTMTADLFGTKNVGLNYGWVFTAYGIGGIIGPIMTGIMRDRLDNWLLAFVISGIACLVAAVIALALKPPQRDRAEVS
ncbi:OFA family MFS transporter [Candidatus Poribacteria bacterium]